ncbi:hypothetical protein BGL48_05750 [Salinivibrio sp. SS3]|nr:hypothetical protein BGL48_05750 [Salinivibrio sp. BNH]
MSYSYANSYHLFVVRLYQAQKVFTNKKLIKIIIMSFCIYFVCDQEIDVAIMFFREDQKERKG